MNDRCHIRTGALNGRTEMPALSYDKEKGSELGYRTDEEALYIGTSDGNKRLCGTKDVGNINARLDALNAIIASINAQITDITARLGALETPSE
jgi:hypothetical protein